MGFFKSIINSIKAKQIPKDKNFRSKLERDMYINNTLGYRNTKDRVDYHDDLFKRLGAIKNRFNESHDRDAYILELENIIQTDPECEDYEGLTLLEQYIANNEYNKAWGYSNKLLTNPNCDISKLRHQQARILKKEKRYIPALDMIMAEYLLKYSNQNNFNRDAFIKEAGVCTRALKWDESMLNDIADILGKQLKSKNYNEVTLHDTFKKYLQSKNILDKEL